MAREGISNLASFATFVRAFELIPSQTTEIMGNYFRESGITNRVAASIKPLIPKSNRGQKVYKGVRREHARYASDSIMVVPGNFRGFLVTNSKYYQYLLFPNLGLGTSKSRPALNFVRRGIELNTSRIRKELYPIIERELQKHINQ